jgi:hypothetical protein
MPDCDDGCDLDARGAGDRPASCAGEARPGDKWKPQSPVIRIAAGLTDGLLVAILPDHATLIDLRIGLGRRTRRWSRENRHGR